MKRILLFLSLFCVTTSVFAISNDLFNDGVALHGELKETIDNREQQDYIEGDANGDGEVNVADIQTIASYILALSDQINFENADVNTDESIDVRDVTIIINDICFYAHEYVDLGLPSGLKWATCNVGAENPEDYGDYFAWGEIEPKDAYTEYNSITFGEQMGDISGNQQCDAATANWGEDWRMPNEEEYQELVDECTWEWTVQNGVNGYKVMGANGNYIFLPAAGYVYGALHHFEGNYGYYWSSTPSGDDGAYGLHFFNGYYHVNGYYRSDGYSVRPVTSGLPAVIIPSVTTSAVINITETTAECGGNVIKEGYAEVTSRGVCWSTSPNPTIDDAHTNDGSGSGEFTSNITGLIQGVTYYVRAYATNELGTAYGEEVSFITEGEFAHEYVDLGLPSGLKWATCNVGAENPEDYGGYFAWGETEPKSTHTIDNSITYGVEMGDISGNPQYDAATANWGEDWRMPTEEECQELVDECMWEWTTQNGVYGRKVTGPNGNHIFLPAAGYRSGSSLTKAGEYGYYWSSTQNSNDNYACGLRFNSSYCDVYYGYCRYNGLSVRPVTSGLPAVIIPSVTTSAVINITETTAECGGNVIKEGDAEVTSRGVCWSTSPNPTIDDAHTNDGSGSGEFTSNITGLIQGVTYYVRAYATNELGTAYGEEVSFTTEGEFTHEYVDLGLPSGLKWATCNVGAENPEDYGDYFAWGETEPKSTYTIDNSITYGVEMEDISGNPQYDAATANWGSTWRMPTREECQELVDECMWEWTTQNGVYGRKVTGPNGNHIFLPAAGFRAGSSLYNAGEYGYCWSSTPDSVDDSAYDLYFISSYYCVGYDNRYIGRSVRPVSE